jgi:hypothetical protein
MPGILPCGIFAVNEATRDIITRGVHGDFSDVVEQPSLPLGDCAS